MEKGRDECASVGDRDWDIGALGDRGVDSGEQGDGAPDQGGASKQNENCRPGIEIAFDRDVEDNVRRYCEECELEDRVQVSWFVDEAAAKLCGTWEECVEYCDESDEDG